MTIKKLENAWLSLQGVPTPTHIIANSDVQIEQKALEQLTQLAYLDHDLKSAGITQGEIRRIVATPDLHVGSPFPVGVAIETHGMVIPGAVGNDIGCGIRLCVFNITEADLEGKTDLLQKNLRHIFFEGARDIVTSSHQRRAILENGLLGLIDTFSDNENLGIWQQIPQVDLIDQLVKTHEGGSLVGSVFFGHEKWILGSGDIHGYDAQLGSIGSGNHFCEMQIVDDVVDQFTAQKYGLTKDQLAVMVHTGSVSLGQSVGSHYRDLAKKHFAGSGADIAEHLYPLIDPQDIDAYMRHMNSSANFATINRLTLSLMMQKALIKTLGREVEMKLIWDAPHNLTWQYDDTFIHRKGATPARGSSPDFGYAGEPVLLPGSMGDFSWVLQGLGSDRCLESASHGAGRAISRTRAAHLEDEKADQKLTVVGPVDVDELVRLGRSDIAREMIKRLKEESPRAYKPVLPALESSESSGSARRVAKMRPILTVKGI